MAPFPPNGFSHGSRNSNGGMRGPSNASSVNLALDNMIRSQLKVSDPRNPKEIAQALLAYYKDLPQAIAINEEAQGLPFLQAAQPAALPPPRPTSSDAEFQIAQGDVEKALGDLSTNPLTNDITPEMNGWAESIRSAISQGYVSARQGLDPSQRDRVIAVRRQLGEYGRMARFVGTLSPGITQNYRRLAQGLDEVAAVILVMLGESLASVGFASGYYLLQVPLAELQQRRDAVIFGLRNFMGGTQQAYGPDDWPRGIEAYRRLYNWLETQGQGDLRSLLIENEIAELMDALISRAQNGTAEGLRALGVTAQLDIERFRRMAIVAPGAMARTDGHYDRSPPLEAYLQALELFADTFRPAGGLRLLRIARPPILFYGIYNPNLLEDDRDLVDLIMVRGNLATIFDGLFPAAGARSADTQVLLDMLLLELDRGIDLLALGTSPNDTGSPSSRRALAYWAIINVILNLVRDSTVYIDVIGVTREVHDPFMTLTGTPGSQGTIEITDSVPITPTVPGWVAIIPHAHPGTHAPTLSGPYLLSQTESRGPFTITATIPARAPAPAGAVSAAGTGWGGRVTLIYLKDQPIGPIAEYAIQNPDFLNLVTRIAQAYQTGTSGVAELTQAINRYQSLPAVRLPPNNSLRGNEVDGVLEELRVQQSLEERWQSLVRTVAPEAGDQEGVFRLLTVVIRQAAFDAQQTVTGAITRRVPYEEPLPPQFEQSLAEIVRTQRRRQHTTQTE